jgi:hypothetical protein
MLQLAERVLLATRPGRTQVVLEIATRDEAPAGGDERADLDVATPGEAAPPGGAGAGPPATAR